MKRARDGSPQNHNVFTPSAQIGSVGGGGGGGGGGDMCVE